VTFPALTIIGERINSSRKSIARAIEAKDESYIRHEARIQHEAGADYIDVNAGTFLGKETEYLPWLVTTVQAAVDSPLFLDSTDPEALKAALQAHRGKPVLNSVTLESSRMDAVVPLALEYSCGVVALLVDSVRIPSEANEKLDLAVRLVNALTGAGIKHGDIYIDPVIQPLGVAGDAGVEMLKAFSMIRAQIPDAHVLCGLRNISFNLPHRHLLDMTFLAMAMAAGIDTAIVDPCDSDIMRLIMAAEALMGKDEYCQRYIAASREGKLGGENP